MENTDRAHERGQARLVQSWRFGLNLNTDKPGAPLHPPRPEPSSASSGTQHPRPAGSSLAGPAVPGGTTASSRAEPGSGGLQPRGFVSAEGGSSGNAAVPNASPLSWSPFSAAPGPGLTCSSPLSIVSPVPGKRRQQTVAASPVWCWGGVSWPSKQNLCF